jgi:hypothetical protein
LKLKTGETAAPSSYKMKYVFIGTMLTTPQPLVTYYSQNEVRQHISFVVISDCLKHDTIALHLFQSKLSTFLSGKLKDLTKIYYFSDGAALQFKNRKNFINLCYHEDDFGMDAEWHFFAMLHSKDACDGLGVQLKG